MRLIQSSQGSSGCSLLKSLAAGKKLMVRVREPISGLAPFHDECLLHLAPFALRVSSASLTKASNVQVQ